MSRLSRIILLGALICFQCKSCNEYGQLQFCDTEIMDYDDYVGKRSFLALRKPSDVMGFKTQENVGYRRTALLFSLNTMAILSYVVGAAAILKMAT